MRLDVAAVVGFLAGLALIVAGVSVTLGVGPALIVSGVFVSFVLGFVLAAEGE